ncbi:PREDICTED: shematrin-like protein 2 [Priapulus caudatus]|uniref:Shematrin-like protein 2 n=1 Tax=Priapulus caudatus TaxID=37621 RepID=A0ABM1EXN6_PRICU|nr:PREDICTED: shematrin-like protein 2 [Priapulus caudatus]
MTTSATMRVLLLLCISGLARAIPYPPEFFVTSTPVLTANARALGSGSKQATGQYGRDGQAAGADYEKDGATAADTAARAGGYEYGYSDGFSWYQPKTLYAFKYAQPAIGYKQIPYNRVIKQRGYGSGLHSTGLGYGAATTGYGAAPIGYSSAGYNDVGLYGGLGRSPLRSRLTCTCV